MPNRIAPTHNIQLIKQLYLILKINAIPLSYLIYEKLLGDDPKLIGLYYGRKILIGVASRLIDLTLEELL